MYNTILPDSSNNWYSSVFNVVRKKYGEFKVIGKGWRSIVLDFGNFVIKVCKNKKIAEREYLVLKNLQRLPFVPKLYGYDKEINGIIMEKIEGENLRKYFVKANEKEIRISVKLCLLISMILDILGYENPEMNRPEKHIIFTNKFPKLIDYERFRKKEKPLNFTKIISFFFFSGGKIREKVEKVYGIKDKQGLIKFMRWYKRNFDEIMNNVLDP